MAAKKFRHYTGLWFRLARLYCRMDLAWFLRDTRVCLGWIACDCITSLASMAGMYLLARRLEGFGGFTGTELLFMLGWALLSTGLFTMLFSSNNIGQVSRIIGRGQLDHVLVQPVPMPIHFTTAGMAPFSCSGPFFCGLALTIYAGAGLRPATGPGWWALAALLLFAGCAVEVSTVYIVSTIAFWAPYAAEEIADEVLRLFDSLAVYPLGGMGAVVQVVLCTIIPVGTMAWLPASILLGKTPALYGTAGLGLVAAAVTCAAILLFRKGLDFYAKYSCPRYSSFGRN